MESGDCPQGFRRGRLAIGDSQASLEYLQKGKRVKLYVVFDGTGMESTTEATENTEPVGAGVRCLPSVSLCAPWFNLRIRSRVRRPGSGSSEPQKE